MTNLRVKFGEISSAEIAVDKALTMMVEEPLLIVRPLMQVGEQRRAGFEVEQVHNWIGLSLDSIGERDPKNCPPVSQQHPERQRLRNDLIRDFPEERQ